MGWIIVGSRALAFAGLNRLTPKDIDVWTDEETINHSGDVTLVPTDLLELLPNVNGYATPNAIYTIKCSHLGYDIHWQKTKLDILFLKNNGCELIDNLYSYLIEFWKIKNGDKAFLSLARTKGEFFKDHVNYIHDHDYLHELVSHPNRPAYESVLRKGEEVLIDKSKFDKLSHASKVRMFREEIAVIACERWVLNPYWKGKVSWYTAYRLSLQKTITNLTKGWATTFIVCHLDEFIKPDFNYFRNILNTLGESNMKGSEVLEEMILVAKVEEEMESEFVIETVAEGYIDDDYSDEFKNNFKHIEQEGGGEGGTEWCHTIFSWKGIIYKGDYSYYSHHGTEFDGFEDTIREVKPIEKTLTVYE